MVTAFMRASTLSVDVLAWISALLVSIRLSSQAGSLPGHAVLRVPKLRAERCPVNSTRCILLEATSASYAASDVQEALFAAVDELEGRALIQKRDALHPVGSHLGLPDQAQHGFDYDDGLCRCSCLGGRPLAGRAAAAGGAGCLDGRV